MKKLKAILDAALHLMFPYKEPSYRGLSLYTFNTETWIDQITRNGNLEKYITNK